jgi:hypothetical protein
MKKSPRGHKNVLREMDFELLSKVFFVFVPNFSEINIYGASCPWGELSMALLA